MKASGVISLGIAPLPAPELDRKSVGAGSDEIFLRSVWEPVPESLSELWSVRWSENPAGNPEYRKWLNVIFKMLNTKRTDRLHEMKQIEDVNNGQNVK